MSTDVSSIRAEGLGKAFSVNSASGGRQPFWAVKDVSFELGRGQVLGVIGRNGSGKTTLLKMLCQVTGPSAGSAEISGRVTAMLGVGTGMHPMFTGRENIFFSGQILGLDHDLIASKLDAIIEFADIGEFVDRPIKTYSSGMRSRLGFAIAAQLEPEILLLDEVLAVGDTGFQQKCLQRIREMRASGSTILLVTHNMNVVKSFCDVVLLMDQGRMVRFGPPDDVVDHFLTNIIHQAGSEEGDGEGTRAGNGALRVDSYHFEDQQGQRIEQVESGGAATLCLDFTCQDPSGVENVAIGVAVADDNGRWLFRVDNEISGSKFDQCPERGTLRCDFQSLPLAAGRYRFGYRIVADGEVADYIVDYGHFEVAAGDFFGTGQVDPHSPVYVKHEWKFDADTAE